MVRRVSVIGVGITPFIRSADGLECVQLAVAASRQALDDGGIAVPDVQQVCVGESEYALAAARELGLTDVVSPDASANPLYQAYQAIAQGSADCVLAIGLGDDQPSDAYPPNIQAFGEAAREHMQRYGTHRETFAMVALKAQEHAAANPLVPAVGRLTLEDVLAAEPLADPLTRLQFCEVAHGAAAVLLCSEQFVQQRQIRNAVRIEAMARSHEPSDSIECNPVFRRIGHDLDLLAASEAYQQAGIGPAEVDVCELHDCCTASEVLLYEALGFCRTGDAGRFVEDGDNTYGGNLPINPSGGLLGRGHAHSATCLAQCTELVWQLRGSAGERQVRKARVALQHSVEASGASMVVLYRKD
ncbi:lipid-transfer protein [compost metagenome]